MDSSCSSVISPNDTIVGHWQGDKGHCWGPEDFTWFGGLSPLNPQNLAYFSPSTHCPEEVAHWNWPVGSTGRRSERGRQEVFFLGVYSPAPSYFSPWGTKLFLYQGPQLLGALSLFGQLFLPLPPQARSLLSAPTFGSPGVFILSC